MSRLAYGSICIIAFAVLGFACALAVNAGTQTASVLVIIGSVIGSLASIFTAYDENDFFAFAAWWLIAWAIAGIAIGYRLLGCDSGWWISFTVILAIALPLIVTFGILVFAFGEDEEPDEDLSGIVYGGTTPQ